MGIQRFHNISLTVKDADASSKWYADHFGFVVESDSERTPEFSAQVTGVPGAHLRVVHMGGHGLHLELMEYKGAAGDTINTDPNNTGCLQIGFVVDDAEALYEKLQADGTTMCSPEPATVPSGPIQGSKIFFCKDPDGVVLKFLSIKK